jgi:pimeloyl-[acyl-carrier protein] methyl ester esterase
MHIESSGSGPPLVLVHGWAMHGGIFQPLRAALEQRFTVHRVDLPGHGASRERTGRLELGDLARRIADAVPEALWLGWSLGGLVALQAALERPRQVRGLVLVATNPRFVVAPDWPHGVAHAVFDAFARELRDDWRGTVDRFLALECIGADHARAELRELRTHVFERGEPALHALEDGLRLLADCDLRAALPRIGVPSLWIAGRRDRLVPWAALQHAAALCGNGSFVAIDGGGHAPFIGHPQRVVDAFAAWHRREYGA